MDSRSALSAWLLLVEMAAWLLVSLAVFALVVLDQIDWADAMILSVAAIIMTARHRPSRIWSHGGATANSACMAENEADAPVKDKAEA